MKYNTAILFVGPCPSPITGQSIAFREAFENYPYKKFLCNTTRYVNNRILNTLYSIFRITFIFLFHPIDKVYFTCSRSNMGFVKDFYLLLLCKLLNKDTINHLHGGDFKLFLHKNSYLKAIKKWSYKSINCSIVLLPKMKEQFSDFPNMKTVAIANGYPKELDNYRMDWSQKKEQILYLSNIMETKGILIFLDAVDEILKNTDHIIVRIAGAPMTDYLTSKKKIEKIFLEKYNELKKNFEHRIFYHQSVQGKDKIELLQTSSVFVLPTFYRTEAFPISILEAMRFGNAIITTKHNYLEDILREGNGILIPTQSVLELKLAIEKLFLNRQELLKIQRNNREFALSEYSTHKYSSALNSLLTSNLFPSTPSKSS